MKVISLETKKYMNRVGSIDHHADEDEQTRLWKFLHRQEKLLYVAFYILLNLAEDIKIELKMVRRGIVKLLSQTLTRENDNLVFLDELLFWRFLF
eukprot:UN27766